MTDALVRALVPIFLIIGLGILAGRSGRLDNTKVGPLNTLVMDFALPSAIFVAITRAHRSQLGAQWSLLLVIAFGLLGLWLLVYWLQRRVFRQSSGSAAVLAISVSLPNFAAAGVPLATAVLGEEGALQVALAIALGATVLSPLTLILLDIDRNRREGGDADGPAAIRAAVRRVSRSPLVLSPLLAILVVLAGIDVPPSLSRTLALLGAASSGVALLLTGLILSANRIAISPKIIAAVLIANVAHPLLAAGLFLPLHAPGPVVHAGLLLSALPAGFFGILFAVRYGVDVRESSSVVALSTLASIVTLTVTLALTAGLR